MRRTIPWIAAASALVLAGIHHLDHMGMVDPGSGPAFPKEPLAGIGPGDGQEFDGHFPGKSPVKALIHDPHGSSPEASQDADIADRLAKKGVADHGSHPGFRA